MSCGSSFVVTIISAVAVRASGPGRPAGHPVPAFVAAADQASDLLGRPGFAARLGLDYSCVVAFLGYRIYAQVNRRLTKRVPFGAGYIWGGDLSPGHSLEIHHRLLTCC